MKLVQIDQYFVSTMDTDGLALQHQSISTCSGEYVTGPFY